MAENDCAILVGVSQYANAAYPELRGPLNDVDLMERWLAKQKVSITKIITQVPPGSTFPNPDTASPLPDDYTNAFLAVERDRIKLQADRASSARLYLYFSGHGFCGRDIDREAEAALYTANASAEKFAHIYGTYFARRAKAKGLFKEVVLIMDCCRDSEVNRMPIPPALTNTPDDTLAQGVRLLMIYAVAKGGKAQERQIAERNNEWHGLLTHAFMTTLERARPDRSAEMSATRLRDHLLESWDAVCGPDPPPRPEVYLPSNEEMYFAAQNTGVRARLDFGSAPAAGTAIALRDGTLRRIAEFSATDTTEDLADTNGAVLSWSRNGAQILLQLAPGFYEYEVKQNCAVMRRVQFKAEQGDIDVAV